MDPNTDLLAQEADEWQARAERAEAQLAEVREALEFYAAGVGWSEIADDGETARAALAKLGGSST